MKKVFLLLFLLSNLTLLFAQTKCVTGVVKDSENNPIIGANIVIKGTKIGIQTDSDGYFKLCDVKVGDVLVISFTGYTTREVTVGEASAYGIIIGIDSDVIDLNNYFSY